MKNRAMITGNAVTLTSTVFAQNSDIHHNPPFLFIWLWQICNLHCYFEARKYWLLRPLVAKSSLPVSFKY